MDFRIFTRLFLFMVLFLGYSASVTWAHGGGVLQLSNAEAGPYRLSVWTQPDPLRVGEVHFTVAVSEPPVSSTAAGEAGAPVLGATVELQLKPAGGNDQTLTALATHEAAVNKLFYEADVELPAAGQWQVVISVEGPAGAGRVGLQIEALPPSNTNWIFLGSLVLALLAAGWLVQKSLKDSRRRLDEVEFVTVSDQGSQ